MANRNISEGRKTTYYIGMGVAGLGGLIFFSSFLFVGIGMLSGSFGMAKMMVITGPLGMFLLIAGGVIRGIGAKGLAGSGIILDPEQAREDVEPWSRMTGGVIKDALDESGINLGGFINSTKTVSSTTRNISVKKPKYWTIIRNF